MSRFAATAQAAHGQAPTSAPTPTVSHQGGTAFHKDKRTEVLTLGLTFLGSSFYESETDRVDRYTRGIRDLVTTGDVDWVVDFLKWLRTSANIRTAAVVGAVEAARAGAPFTVIDDVCTRADEPAEALGYHLAKHGRKMPRAVKRGIAAAATRRYNEFAALKYTARGANVQPGDVLALTHPTPRNAHQVAVFRYLTDVRQGRTDPRTEGLPVIEAARAWLAAPNLETIPEGLPWESVLSAGVDAGLHRSSLWGRLIDEDSLGYMALLRNLRNIEQAEVTSSHIARVSGLIANPDQVRTSRQLPFRFYSAYKALPGLAFAYALEQALDVALENLPRYEGRTLVLVDTSASMTRDGQSDSASSPVEVAALFAAGLKRRNPHGTEVVIFGDQAGHVQDLPTVSALKAVDRIMAAVGTVGHGTNTWGAAAAALEKLGQFDRVIVLTDAQNGYRGHWHGVDRAVPQDLPVYVYDLQGYKTASVDGTRNRYLFSGLSDQFFTMPVRLEAGRDAGWPWEG